MEIGAPGRRNLELQAPAALEADTQEQRERQESKTAAIA
jgi:hypothetical protein